MLRLTVDDQPIEVSQGYTPFQAARDMGGKESVSDLTGLGDLSGLWSSPKMR